MKPSLSTTRALSGDTMHGQLIAAALLAVIFCTVVAAMLLFGLDAPYAFAVGVIVTALVKADDARIRRARRFLTPAP